MILVALLWQLISGCCGGYSACCSEGAMEQTEAQWKQEEPKMTQRRFGEVFAGRQNQSEVPIKRKEM